jgi:hypothetical protein
MKFKFSFLSVFINLIILTSNIDILNGLKCYSCSTSAGDRFCTEDHFDSEHLTVVECPSTADVCVRAIQLNNGNSDSKISSAGSVFRACGTSTASTSREILSLGYYPIKNSCVVRRIGAESANFNNSVFQICSCEGDISNGSGIKCNNNRENT